MIVNNYKEYLIDLTSILIDKMNELEIEISVCNPNDKEYLKGQIMAYYDTLTTLKSQAELFDIQLADLHLEKINLERYLALK